MRNLSTEMHEPEQLTVSLESLVDTFGSLNEKTKLQKKELDEQSKIIKNIMKSSSLEKLSGEKFIANYSVIKSEFFNDEKLLEKIRKIWNEYGTPDEECPWIKCTYSVDMDKLESLIYSGTIRAEDLSDCKESKETERLVVKVIKK